jgi:hypothetical protein
MLTITGDIDDFDGLSLRKHFDKHFDCDRYEVQAFTTTGEHMKLEHIVGFSFSPSLLEQARFIEDAAKAGKKLRITIEAVD